MAIRSVTGKEFEALVKESPVPVVLDVWADWCQPCHILAPELEKAARYYGERVRFVKLDADAERHTSELLGVKALPTMLFFHHGAEQARLEGAHNQAGIRMHVEKARQARPSRLGGRGRVRRFFRRLRLLGRY